MGSLGSHADAFAQRRVRVDGLADIHAVGTHFDRQRDLADHVTGMRADDATTHDAMRFGIEQQLGETFVTTVGNGATRR